MKRILSVMLATLCWLVCAQAHAITVTGTLSYTRAWDPIDNNAYGDGYTIIPSSQWTGTKPLVDVYVCMKGLSSGIELCANPSAGPGNGFTDVYGSFTLSAGLFDSSYALRVYFQGRNPVTGGGGYRVLSGNSAAGPTAFVQIGTFTTPTGSSTWTIPPQTLTPCSPTSNTCPNDYANGHQMMYWAATRWRNLGFTNNVTNFEAALANVSFFTDGSATSSCGFSGCCNFDFGKTEIDTCWHEIGHALHLELTDLNGTKAPNEYEGQEACEEDNYVGGRNVSEALANLNSIMMGYFSTDIGLLSNYRPYVSTVGSFEADDADNDCTSCEYAPSATSYPVSAGACGLDPDNYVRRTEARATKVLIDMVDNVAVNGTGCLSEDVILPYSTIFQLMSTFPNNALESGIQETSVNESGSQGTAQGGMDAFGVFDLISKSGLTNERKFKLWANSCYLPGDSAASDGEILGGHTPVSAPW